MIPALFFGCTAALRNRTAKTILAQARQRTKGRKIGLLCFKLTFFSKELFKPNIYTLLKPLNLEEWIIFEKLAAVLVDPPFHKSVQEKIRFHLLTCGTYILGLVYIMVRSEDKDPTLHGDYAAKLQNPYAIFFKGSDG